MNNVTNELRKELNKNMGSVSTLDNVDITRIDTDYWIEILQNASWIVDGEEQNFLDLVFSHVTEINICKNDALLGALAVIKAERKQETETIYTHSFDEIHTKLWDYEFQINKNNYIEYLERLFRSNNLIAPIDVLSNKIIYDVTIKGQEAVPDCDECQGHGVVPCNKCGDSGCNNTSPFDFFGLPREASNEIGNNKNDLHYGIGVVTCKRCGGEGHLHCDNCDNGHVTCPRCGGTGYNNCPSCGGTGSITYNAGNYADGSVKIKSKNCPVCDGKGILTCPVCHGQGGGICPVCGGVPDSDCPECNGNGFKECPKCHGTGEKECSKCHGLGKEYKTDCVQFVKSFVDKYSVDGDVNAYLIPVGENDEPVFVFGYQSNSFSSLNSLSVDWFKSHSLSQAFNQKGHLVEDNSQMIANEVCGTSERIIKAFEKIRKNPIYKNKDDKNRVCSIESYYRLENVLTLTIKHTLENFDDVVLYLYDGNVWNRDVFPMVSASEKMGIMAKDKLKKFFKRFSAK